MDWMVGSSIAATACSIVVAIFLKMFPKGKIFKAIEKPCYVSGQAFSKVLALKFGKATAEDIEEGFFVTLLDSIAFACECFKRGLIEDNKGKDSATDPKHK